MENDDPTPLARAIRRAIDASGKTRNHFDRQLQTLLGTKGKWLYDIERGKIKRPSAEVIGHIERVMALPPDRLMDIAYPTLRVAPAPPAQMSPIDDGDAVPVTSLDLSVSMGPGTIVEDFVESEPVYMDLRLLQIITRTPSDRLRLIKGIGDSMEPTLRTGDRILVDINDRQLARINGIYWIDHFGLHGIKRLRGSAAGKVMVMSDNQNVPDFEADAADVRIHGRVIWFGREL